VQRLVNSVRDLGAPVIYFANAASHLLELTSQSGADVLGVCWRMPIDVVSEMVGDEIALQGNLDPHALFAHPDEVRRMATDILDRMSGRRGHIMNLGHGILPDTPIAGVEALIGAM
jgi:uroporphyrinogen decarboxylase